MNGQEYYRRLAAAYLRGYAIRTACLDRLPSFLRETADIPLTDEEWRCVQDLFAQEKLKLYRFKQNPPLLPRVKKTLGFLHAVQPQSLLDVGSGRGAFLFPFLEEFPWVETTSIDLLDYRIRFLQDIGLGGISNLHAAQADLCAQPFARHSFDVVALLEVLEHIPNAQEAVTAAVQMAKRYIVLTVPSKEDNNPEHIHLFTKDSLTQLFANAGCTKLHFDGVPGHLFLTVTL